MSLADKAGGEDLGKPTSMRKIATASFIGTTIEWYDFFLYGTAAALVFDKLFFPNADPTVGTLSAFATFAVGFLARPVGGAVFGHYGDRIGRKSMLIITLTTMGVATFLIGCLPTYGTIGIWAPILLVVLRIVQGFGLGGEWGGAVLMATEHAPKGKRGFYGSWPQIGASAGLLISTAVFTLVSNLTTEQQFLDWGWRIPFLVSIGLIGVGLFIRLRILETPAFTQVKEAEQESSLPLVEVVKHYPKQVGLSMGMRLSENVTFYIVNVFALSYAVDELGMDKNTVLAGVLVGAGLGFVSIPFYGALSDRVGRRPVYLTGAIASIFLAFIFFALLQTESVVLIVLAYVLVMNTAHDAQYGAQAAYFSELFGTKVRYSGASLGAQMGGVIGGGFAPMIATGLLAAGGGSWVPVAVYLAAVCLVTAISTFLTDETYQTDLAEAEGRPLPPRRRLRHPIVARRQDHPSPWEPR